MPNYNTENLLRPSEIRRMNVQSELQSKKNLKLYFTRNQMEDVTIGSTGHGRSPNFLNSFWISP
jgi:hypothetical protein